MKHLQMLKWVLMYHGMLSLGLWNKICLIHCEIWFLVSNFVSPFDGLKSKIFLCHKGRPRKILVWAFLPLPEKSDQPPMLII